MTVVTSTKANGYYTIGEIIDITVTFSKVVTVDTTGGTPYLELETGTTDRNATYISGSDTNILTFEYTVQNGDTTPDLNYKDRDSLKLNGSTIRYAPDKDAILTLVPSGYAGSLDTQKTLVIDTTAPSVDNITSTTNNGSYTKGEVIDITVTFSEAVTVDTDGGTPYLELETGDTDRKAVYISGSDTDTLTFQYTVQAGDTTLSLDYTGTGSLNLNGGTIRDAAGNDAVLTLAAPGDPGSLGADNALVIGTEAEDSSWWIWLVTILGALSLLPVIGSIVIIKRRRTAENETKKKSARRKAKRK